MKVPPLPSEMSQRFNRINLLSGIMAVGEHSDVHAALTQTMLKQLQQHFEGRDWTDKLEYRRIEEEIANCHDRSTRHLMIVRALGWICIRSQLYTRAPGEMPYLVYAAIKSAAMLGVPQELLITTALLLYPVEPVL